MKHTIPAILLQEYIDNDTRRALLAANLTRNHHYIAQTEQRQFAFNPDVNPQNQNVYRWRLQGKTRRLSQADSVNIENNLGATNLYTLCHLAHSDKQHNLEGWFSRYESPLEQHIHTLRQPNTQPAQRQNALRCVFKLKLLSLLRNPHNHNHWLCRHLYRINPIATLPAHGFLDLIRQRTDLNQAAQPFFQRQSENYARWLAHIYHIMCDHYCAPSWFEHICATLLSEPDAIHFHLHHYPDPYCLFADTGFALQRDQHRICLGFALASDLLLIWEINRSYWQALPDTTQTCPIEQALPISINQHNHTQRHIHNRLCLLQAKHAVYGHSAHAEDYLTHH